jgi:hypothetical protein
MDNTKDFRKSLANCLLFLLETKEAVAKLAF